MAALLSFPNNATFISRVLDRFSKLENAPDHYRLLVVLLRFNRGSKKARDSKTLYYSPTSELWNT